MSDDSSDVEEAAAQKWADKPSRYIGRRIGKLFDGKMFFGSVTGVDNCEDTGVVLFQVTYQDGDVEDVEMTELKQLLRNGRSKYSHVSAFTFTPPCIFVCVVFACADTVTTIPVIEDATGVVDASESTGYIQYWLHTRNTLGH